MRVLKRPNPPGFKTDRSVSAREGGVAGRGLRSSRGLRRVRMCETECEGICRWHVVVTSLLWTMETGTGGGDEVDYYLV
jgi:hypothetical protein